MYLYILFLIINKGIVKKKKIKSIVFIFFWDQKLFLQYGKWTKQVKIITYHLHF